jgi:hypothetical protein
VLHAVVAELIGGANAIPLRRAFRRAPPQIADGWCRVRNPEIGCDAVVGDAAQRAGLDRHEAFGTGERFERVVC